MSQCSSSRRSAELKINPLGWSNTKSEREAWKGQRAAMEEEKGKRAKKAGKEHIQNEETRVTFPATQCCVFLLPPFLPPRLNWKEKRGIHLQTSSFSSPLCSLQPAFVPGYTLALLAAVAQTWLPCPMAGNCSPMSRGWWGSWAKHAFPPCWKEVLDRSGGPVATTTDEDKVIHFDLHPALLAGG